MKAGTSRLGPSTLFRRVSMSLTTSFMIHLTFHSNKPIKLCKATCMNGVFKYGVVFTSLSKCTSRLKPDFGGLKSQNIGISCTWNCRNKGAFEFAKPFKQNSDVGL